MERIDAEKAAKARDFVYSGKVFKEGVREEAEEEAQEEAKNEVVEESKEERERRMEEIRAELFNGKLFK